MLRSYKLRFSFVHIGAPANRIGARESQQIHTIQDVFGPTLRETGFDYGTVANAKSVSDRIEFSRRRENPPTRLGSGKIDEDTLAKIKGSASVAWVVIPAGIRRRWLLARRKHRRGHSGPPREQLIK
jgi:hypothetical protein